MTSNTKKMESQSAEENIHLVFVVIVVIAMGFFKKNWKNSFTGRYT